MIVLKEGMSILAEWLTTSTNPPRRCIHSGIIKEVRPMATDQLVILDIGEGYFRQFRTNSLTREPEILNMGS